MPKALIRTTIEQQLRVAPGTPTRTESGLKHRHRLTRLGNFDSDRTIFESCMKLMKSQETVNILAIGIKDRNRLLIGAEEFK